jgi:hypothetical protein
MEAINARQNMDRINAYIPKNYKKWLEKESLRTGLTLSALIVTALGSYIDQRDFMECLPELTKILKELNEKGIQTEIPKMTIDKITDAMGV